VREARNAARPVTAHLSFGTVSVQVTHPEVKPRAGRRFNQQNTIGTNGSASRTEPGRKGVELIFGYNSFAIIRHNKVVTGTVHLGKLQSHCRLAFFSLFINDVFTIICAASAAARSPAKAQTTKAFQPENLAISQKQETHFFKGTEYI
jgi:hypothetical protein